MGKNALFRARALFEETFFRSIFGSNFSCFFDKNLLVEQLVMKSGTRKQCTTDILSVSADMLVSGAISVSADKEIHYR